MSIIRPSFGKNATLEIAVLATYGKEVFGIDLASKAFVRFDLDLPEFSDINFNTYSIWKISLSPEQITSDPSRPELIEVVDITPVGQVKKKRSIVQLCKSTSAPRDLPILGFNGPSISYGQLTGRSPSMSIIELTKRQAIRKNSYDEITLSFPWGPIITSLPLGNDSELELIKRAPGPLTSDKDISAILGFRPKFVLVGLARPKNGYCRKMALGLLPEKISRKTTRAFKSRLMETDNSPDEEYSLEIEAIGKPDGDLNE